MEKVFVYKTLMNQKIDHDALGHYVDKTKDAILPDYKDVNKGSGYHTIIKAPGSRVKGKELFVDDKDLKKLDDWEEKYRRIKVTLEDGTKVWAYQLKVQKIVEAFILKTLL